jgi:plastocyanin
MRTRWFSLFALVLALGLVAAACGGGEETPSGGNTTGAPSPTETEAEGGTITINGDTANNKGTKEVTGDETEVEMDDFYFEPTIIKAAPGTDFKVELFNESNNLHNFSLDDQNIDQDVEAGENFDVMVTIPDSGQLEFYCKYHKSQGMVGAIEAS